MFAMNWIFVLTTSVPHLGSSTLTKSNSNCRSSAIFANKSIQNPEQHWNSSVVLLFFSVSVSFFLFIIICKNVLNTRYKNLPWFYSTSYSPVHITFPSDRVWSCKVDKWRLFQKSNCYVEFFRNPLRRNMTFSWPDYVLNIYPMVFLLPWPPGSNLSKQPINSDNASCYHLFPLQCRRRPSHSPA